MSHKPTRTKRRWRQFTLRGLLVLTTLMVLLLVGWRTYVEPYRAQRRVMALIEELGGSYSTQAGGLGWLRSLFGAAHFQDVTTVDLADCDQPERYLPHLRRLPQLYLLIIGGRNVADAELDRLKKLPALGVLVLDSTRVTDASISAFTNEYPHVTVHKSQRRAVAALQKIAPDSVSGETRFPSPPLASLVGGDHFFRATGVHFLVSRSSLTDADLANFGALTDVEYIHLILMAPAQFTDAGMAALSGLRKLKSLTVHRAPQITDAAFDHIARISSLTAISLIGNGITDRGLEYLANCKNLTMVNILDEPGITDNGLLHLSGLPLEHVQLNGANVTDEGMAHLAKIATLRRLSLDGTPISDAGVAKLASVKNIETLWLGSNVTGEGVKSLQQLEKLKQLSLRCKCITEAGLAHLAGCDQLQILFLEGPGRTDAWLAEVAKIKELRILHSRGLPISDEGLKHLRALTHLEQLELEKTGNRNVNLRTRDDVREFLDSLK